MKRIARKMFCLTLLCLITSIPAFAGGGSVDLSARRAIYVTAKPKVIDLKNDKYVVAGGTITLNKSQAVGCQGNKCTFNLGVIATRSNSKGALETYGQFIGKTIGIVGNTISFSDGEGIKQHVLAVDLIVGKNVVTFMIDPQNKTAE